MYDSIIEKWYQISATVSLFSPTLVLYIIIKKISKLSYHSICRFSSDSIIHFFKFLKSIKKNDIIPIKKYKCDEILIRFYQSLFQVLIKYKNDIIPIKKYKCDTGSQSFFEHICVCRVVLTDLIHLHQFQL